MNFDDPRIERYDPNAPKVLDLTKCQRWIASAQNYRRQPLGGFIADDLLPQLKCACDELAAIGTKIADAQNMALRYQKESENANAEVRAMQRILGDERAKTATLESEISTLKAQLEAAKPKAPEVVTAKPEPAPSAAPAKRVRKAKVVPIEQPKAATR